MIDALKGKAEELKDKAAQATRARADKAHDVVENAGGFVDAKTGGKFSEHVGNARQAAHGLLAKVGSNGGPTSA